MHYRIPENHDKSTFAMFPDMAFDETSRHRCAIAPSTFSSLRFMCLLICFVTKWIQMACCLSWVPCSSQNVSKWHAAWADRISTRPTTLILSWVPLFLVFLLFFDVILGASGDHQGSFLGQAGASQDHPEPWQFPAGGCQMPASSKTTFSLMIYN